MRPSLLTALAVVLCAGAVAAMQVPSPDSVPLLTPEVDPADGSGILPHRLELEEITRYPNDSTDLDSFTYVTVEHAQAWDELQLVIDWSALTWNGTGHDRNVVTQRGLALRGRVTPSGVPFAYYVGSHHFPGSSNLVQVNPDGELHRYATWDGRESGVHNEIVYPYLLSRLELWEGRRFVLPAFNPYRADAPFQYRLFIVRSPVTIEDDEGHHHRGWQVDAASRDDLDAARALADSFPDAHARYFVSQEPPYFLGKEWVAWTDGAGRTVHKVWSLVRHQPLAVTMRDRMNQILEIRARRGAGQTIPWRPEEKGSR